MNTQDIALCLITFSGIAASYSNISIFRDSKKYRWCLFVSLLFWIATIAILLFFSTAKIYLYNLGFFAILSGSGYMLAVVLFQLYVLFKQIVSDMSLN